jgi:2-polyprenyl-3-methyl-5-hydroxy-6-metoxy-1,4-benzoquinol methylase
MPNYRLHRDPMSSHQRISSLLKSLRPTRILDVGAAQGFLGQLLAGSGLVIDAIEPNPHGAEHAKPFYRQVFAATVEQAHPSDRYDAIVCADVLEHLVDPPAVLRQLRQVATEDATFVISLPNIAHLAVRTMLLLGRFPKMDRGPLDRTHLHFFTRDTAETMLRQAGLQIESVFATGVPLDELLGQEKTFLYQAALRAQGMMVRLLPRLFGFQWVFVARFV